MSTVQVVPNNFTLPITNFKIDWFFQINLNVSATFNVFVFNNNQQLYTVQITLDGEDYNKWGDNDSYLTDFVAKKLGLTIMHTTVGPTNDVTGPTSDVTGPTNDVAGPTGDVTGPTSDVTGPTGDVTGPTGQLAQ